MVALMPHEMKPFFSSHAMPQYLGCCLALQSIQNKALPKRFLSLLPQEDQSTADELTCGKDQSQEEHCCSVV